MPKHKKDALEFELKVTDDGQRVKITVPRVLYLRLESATAIVGDFTLTKEIMTLKEDYRLVTAEQLCSRFWPVPGVESKEELDELDWDDLLTRMRIELHNPENKNIIVSDWDSTTYDQFHVSFEM